MCHCTNLSLFGIRMRQIIKALSDDNLTKFRANQITADLSFNKFEQLIYHFSNNP